MIKFNANHFVRLRLRKRGWEIFGEIVSQLSSSEMPSAMDGVMTIQLFKAMHVFGPYCKFDGLDTVFETEIELLLPEETD